MTALPTVRTVADLRAETARWRAQGLKIGLVPTMGALHEGHLSLVRLAKTRADKVVASLFVNPKQFAPHEDLARYPRDEAGDAQKLASAGCDLMFAPSADVMYPADFATAVTVSGVSAPLEGEARPHFFGGVATVVAKLLLQTLPDVACFGEKDYQQLLVIKRMARDLDMPVEIIGGPTVRESDGLAMSSRNAYLSPAERATAAELHATLQRAAAALRAGAAVCDVEREARDALAQAGFAPVDYVSARDPETLAPLTHFTGAARLLAAAWLGKTRLIDNIGV